VYSQYSVVKPVSFASTNSSLPRRSFSKGGSSLQSNQKTVPFKPSQTQSNQKVFQASSHLRQPTGVCRSHTPKKDFDADTCERLLLNESEYGFKTI